MTKTTKHQWAFRSRFRARAYSWRGTKLASQRLREAVSEIRKIRSKDPILAAEGAVLLVEKLWPALEQIDTSSGALGTAVNKTLDALLPILIEAGADPETRDLWLDRLWQAYLDDCLDYAYPIAVHWGELCGSPETASRWADDLLWKVRLDWEQPSYSKMAVPCLSALLAAERHDELLELVETARHSMWIYRQFGTRALVALGRLEEALQYAEASQGLNEPYQPIARVCEEILLQMGRGDEAYRDYALSAHTASTHLATFRAIVKKYPEKDPDKILADLIASAPGQEGKWFATAKKLGKFSLAIELAQRSPVDPRTLNRAARDHLESNPEFARAAALVSLDTIAQGFGYEITSAEVHDALDHLVVAARALGAAGESVAVAYKMTSRGADWVHEIVCRRFDLPKILPDTLVLEPTRLET